MRPSPPSTAYDTGSHLRPARPIAGTYRTWLMMIQQCENPRVGNYARHGGLGVRVCPRWRRDYALFLRDMGPRPDGCSIRRVDPLGDYAPSNAYWAPSRLVRPEGAVVRAYRKRAKKRAE